MLQEKAVLSLVPTPFYTTTDPSLAHSRSWRLSPESNQSRDQHFPRCMSCRPPQPPRDAENEASETNDECIGDERQARKQEQDSPLELVETITCCEKGPDPASMNAQTIRP